MRTATNRRSRRSHILIRPIYHPPTAVESRSISRNSPSNDRTPRLWLSARLADWVSNRWRASGDDGLVVATDRIGPVARGRPHRLARCDIADHGVPGGSPHVGIARSG